MAHPWMPLYVSDYLADTGHLSTVEHGAYILLIMHYWQNGGLPTGDSQLSRICRMTLREWRKIKESLADLFGEEWSHKRIDAEILKADDVTNKRRAAGRASASVRYNKTPTSVATHVEQTNQQSHTQPQSQSPKERKTAAAVVLPREEGAAAAKMKKLDLDKIEAECRTAAGLEEAAYPGLFNLSPILTLLDRGYDLDRDILPVLRAVAARSGQTKPRSWAFFIPAITEVKNGNEKIIQLPAQPARNTEQKNEKYWQFVAKFYETADGLWDLAWGEYHEIPKEFRHLFDEAEARLTERMGQTWRRAAQKRGKTQ